MRGEPQDMREPLPYLRLAGDGPASAAIVAVPHAGRYYPPALESQRAASWHVLHALEDRYADRLVGRAVAAGATAIVATHARGWIDLNRAPEDRCGAPISAQARAGLGIVPHVVAGQPLWRAPVTQAEVARRVATVHEPYHAAVAAALAAARERYGYALLIDCHSMPPVVIGPARGAALVFGDRLGASAAVALSEAMLARARDRGLHASRNTPYQGAYTLDRHADVAGGTHAIQIELDRSLYLLPGLREPSAALPEVANLLAELVAVALSTLAATYERHAAE